MVHSGSTSASWTKPSGRVRTAVARSKALSGTASGARAVSDGAASGSGTGSASLVLRAHRANLPARQRELYGRPRSVTAGTPASSRPRAQAGAVPATWSTRHPASVATTANVTTPRGRASGSGPGAGAPGPDPVLDSRAPARRSASSPPAPAPRATGTPRAARATGSPLWTSVTTAAPVTD